MRNPSNFRTFLLKWPNQHIWANLNCSGDGRWIYEAIQNQTLVCVADGSYIRELHSTVCATALIMECSRGSGRLTLSFTDTSPHANAYRGELLGLMAIFLILHGVHLSQPGLPGSVMIYSDCQGALTTVTRLSSLHCPPNWKHSDVLQLIVLYGQGYSFSTTLHHVKAHQDDNSEW